MSSARDHSVSLLVALLILPPASTAFDTPLSETAVREAYFLGQRHDDSLGRLLTKYSLYFQPPETGPYIQSVSFLTPYVLVALNSNQQVRTYSAQQAQIDHDKNPEVVRVVVQILLTDTYGPYLVRPTGSGSNSPKGFTPRPSDFWRDFRLRTLQKDELVIPGSAKGEPTFHCEEYSCVLTGATLTFEYPAAAFREDSAVIQIDPPEGPSISADFDLTSLR
jgi:hypothetical protein